MASMYAVYHGREGLELIARRVHRMAAILAEGIRRGGLTVVHDQFFDTIQVKVPFHADAVLAAARQRGVNLHRVDADTVAIACDEVTERPQVEAVWAAFRVHGSIDVLDASTHDALPGSLLRTSDFLTHPVFSQHRSETQMLRYLRKLSGRDVALDRSMIPLGSCTMKLNATTEMQAVTWPEFATIHPFVPIDQADGYLRADQRPRAVAGRRSPATTRCRCSRTPARRASSRACSRSAATTARAATSSATSA